MITTEMKKLLELIADLCNEASETVFEDEGTKDILNTCDNLRDMIDKYLNAVYDF